MHEVYEARMTRGVVVTEIHSLSGDGQVSKGNNKVSPIYHRQVARLVYVSSRRHARLFFSHIL